MSVQSLQHHSYVSQGVSIQLCSSGSQTCLVITTRYLCAFGVRKSSHSDHNNLLINYLFSCYLVRFSVIRPGRDCPNSGSRSPAYPSLHGIGQGPPWPLLQPDSAPGCKSSLVSALLPFASLIRASTLSVSHFKHLLSGLFFSPVPNRLHSISLIILC